MIFRKYTDFKDSYSLNENVQQAKNYLKKLALDAKKQRMEGKSPKRKEGEEETPITLTPEEIRQAEHNKSFLDIKNMLNDNPGYVYSFLKFHLDNEIPMEELQNLYNKLKEYRQSLNQLPMGVDRYGDVKPDDTDQRSGYERLGDDIEKIRISKITKKWVDQLLPYQKEELRMTGDLTKEKVAAIASSFDDFGKESNGTKNMAKNKELQDLFFSKIRRYNNINEVIVGANNFIKASQNNDTSKFFQAIQAVNKKYGEINGAEIVWNENGIIILEIKSFQANKDLNSNTSHCIKDSQSTWDSYVGSDSNFNKQYYIYNTNLSTGDAKSVIGITIQPGKESIRACHDKRDGGFSGQIKDYMKSLKIPFDVLAPMTPKEIETKKRRVEANKKIVSPGLSMAQVKQYFEDGADPNTQSGKALVNAVAEDNLDSAKYLLEVGANPNIAKAISKAKSLEMIKLLIANGSEMANEVFERINGQYETVSYLLDHGLDANFNGGIPLRSSCKLGRLDIAKLLVSRGAKLGLRRGMALKWACQSGHSELIDYIMKLMEKGDKDARIPPVDPDEVIEQIKGKSSLLTWVETSYDMTDKDKKDVIALLNGYIKHFEEVKKQNAEKAKTDAIEKEQRDSERQKREAERKERRK